ncbi:MAG: A/G-specific adenine glycosylase, partial [Pseudomonadota bacterium]
VIDWYDRHRRTLPWRAAPGTRPDPYHVWLSEVMLQQTTVVTVKPYFEKFLALWPTVGFLAAADREAVMAAWAGLGYYARARNLHSCAQVVVDRHGGQFPDTVEELRALPGIGEYTAAAIASIAFDISAPVVDGNIERVMARLFVVDEPLPGSKPILRQHAADLTPRHRPGDHAQALMDIGATICTPKKPVCGFCPVTEFCGARPLGIAETLPRKAPKKQKPTRRAMAFWLEDGEHNVLLRRRPDKGLLGGMMEVPSSPWVEHALPEIDAVVGHAPAEADWILAEGVVRHTFTHFHLELAIATGIGIPAEPMSDPYRWVPLDALGGEALPTVMRKIARFSITAD